MSAAAIKLGLLVLALVPLLIHNLRTGEVKNVLIAAMLAMGVAATLFGPAMGAAPLTASTLAGWAGAALILLTIAAFGLVPGGVAKFLIALLPWFPFGDYLLVVTIGMILTAVIGWATGRTVPIVAPMLAASLAIGAMTVLGVDPL